MDRYQCDQDTDATLGRGITEKMKSDACCHGPVVFPHWVRFPWRQKTCLPRLNGWLGGVDTRTSSHSDILSLRTPVMVSCPLWGTEGSPLSVLVVSLLPPGLVLLAALVQSWLLSAELGVDSPSASQSMSGVAGGCHGSRGEHLPAALSSQSPACVEGRAWCVALPLGLVVITVKRRAYEVLRLL